MKKTILLSLFLFLNNFLFSQCNGRYQSEIFNSVNKIVDVNYAEYIQYFDNEHEMDVYMPDGDTEANRPLILFMHGGSFYAGDKENTDCVDFCESFAKRGYVTASVNYRLANMMPFLTSTETQYETVLKAVADIKAAIRYFRHDYATNNSYNIDTNTIFVAGSSAGAVTAIHLAYIDDISNLPINAPNATGGSPIDVQFLANNNGGIEGDVGFANYNSNISGVISFAGGINDLDWIDSSDEPLVSIQGDNDGTVDYSCAPAMGGIIQLILCGSGEMHQRANSVNIINDHLLFSGADHDWFIAGNSDNRFVDALEFTTNFLYPLLPCYQETVVSEIHTTEKQLIKITDVLGRNAKPTINTPLFYIYNDGSVEKKIILQ